MFVKRHTLPTNLMYNVLKTLPYCMGFDVSYRQEKMTLNTTLHVFCIYGTLYIGISLTTSQKTRRPFLLTTPCAYYIECILDGFSL